MAGRLSALFHRKQTMSAYDRIIEWCVILTIGLVPLFVVPSNTDPLELPKVFLFSILTLVALVAWLLKVITGKEQRFKRTAYDIPVVLFALFTLIATIFSVYRFRSMAGVSGYYADSLFSVIFLVLFFLVVSQNIRREQIAKLLWAFFVSAGVILIFNVLQAFGLFVLPWNFTKIVSFNAVANSSVTMSVYLAITALLAVYVLLAKTELAAVKTAERIGLIAVIVLSFFLQLMYDQQVGWIAMMLGLVLLVVFLNVTRRHMPSTWLIIPTILIGFSLLAMFINTQALLRANIGGDVQLPVSVGWQSTLDIVKSKPLFGWGPETFDASFAQHRPDAFNMSPLWELRFIKSSNQWFQVAVGTGILGLLAFAGIAVLLVVQSGRMVVRGNASISHWWQRFGLFALALIVVFASFMTAFNFILALLLWACIALSVVLRDEKATKSNTVSVAKNNSRQPTAASFFPSLGFSVVVILGIVFIYFAARIWWADALVNRANRMIERQEDLEKVRTSLSTSIELNPYEYATYFDLANNLLVQAQLGAQKEAPDVNQLRVLLSGAVASAQTGAAKYKANPDASYALAKLYSDIDALTAATSEQAVAAFTEAIQREPNHPKLHMELGQYHLGSARILQTQADAAEDEAEKSDLSGRASQALSSAKAEFEKAVALKSDYTDAKLNIALVMRVQGEGDKAVAYLEELSAQMPFNVDVLFNLSENYIIDEEDDKAIDVLERIVSIFPGHSDARFRLAQLFEKKGDIAAAIAQLEEVEKLNPENESIKTKLEELRSKA